MASSAAEPPVIGVTTYLEQAQTGVWDVRAAFLPEVYVHGVTDAGGVAVLLPPQAVHAGTAAAVLDRLDGLVVSGGADVDPARYGHSPHERTAPPRRDRDAWEDALLREAIAHEMPFLGICRGAQMLNVHLGGTLHQHVPELVGDERYQPGPAVFGREPVTIEPGTALSHILKTERLEVPVYHHQSIDAVGDGLVVTARTDDGIVEAVERRDAAFGVAVQWHPEEDAADRRLFAALVDAARDYRARRASASHIQEERA